MTTELGRLARDRALPYYAAALPAHDEYHAKRVHDLAVQLADRVSPSVDESVLTAAAWFHDIGRPRERVGEVDDHGEWAAGEAADLLESEDVATDRIEAVQHCLRAHSIRPSAPGPNTVEAELLFDADKLDAIGAVGLVRLACIVGERSGRTGDRYAVIDDASTLPMADDDGADVELLREWGRERLEALHTDQARRFGADRWSFVEEFFDQFERETTAGTGRR